FADLFEVKTGQLVRRGRIVTRWHGAELETSYANRDFHRKLIFRPVASTSPPEYANGRVTFDVQLAPGARSHTCCHYVLVHERMQRRPRGTCYDRTGPDEDRRHREWLQTATTLTSANEDVYRLYRQSVEDMGALRLHDYDRAPNVWLAAAGVPWFVAIFGRDSLIASLQNMIVHAGFARGALGK